MTANPRSPSPLARPSGRDRRRWLSYQEAITINANTGIPLKMDGGTPGTVDTTVTWVVTRVNLADIAAGKF